MNGIKTIITYSFVLVSILFTGCKTLKTVEQKESKKIPETFASKKDSVNSANINWKTYFSDPNLIALIEEGLNNNFDLLQAYQNIELARSDVGRNKGALFPNVSGGVAASQRKFGHYTMDDAGNRTTEIEPGKIIPTHLPDYFVGIQVSWEADIWGKLRNRKKAALAHYLGSVEGKNLVVTNLIADIAITYYELMALDNELDIIRETIQLQEKALEVVKIQKEAAAANELAVQQFEAQVLNSQALEKMVMQRIIENENKINFLVGRYQQPIIRDKSEFTKPVPFQVSVGIPSDMLTNRPDIRQAEYEVVASKANVKAAKAAFYPSLNIDGTAGFQAFKPNYLFITPQSIAYGLFGSLAAPIINRSAIKAEFKNANAYQQQALYNYQKSIMNGYVEVYNEVARIKNLEEIYDLKSREVNVLTRSIETSSELFRTGRASYLEVLMTQKNSLQSKLELVNTRQSQYTSSIIIYKALGGGWK